MPSVIRSTPVRSPSVVNADVDALSRLAKGGFLFRVGNLSTSRASDGGMQSTSAMDIPAGSTVLERQTKVFKKTPQDPSVVEGVEERKVLRAPNGVAYHTYTFTASNGAIDQRRYVILDARGAREVASKATLTLLPASSKEDYLMMAKAFLENRSRGGRNFVLPTVKLDANREFIHVAERFLIASSDGRFFGVEPPGMKSTLR
jgi:hypothetical protein